MNAQKFTQKSLEAVQNAQNLASEYQNMQIEQVHLLAALVQQEDCYLLYAHCSQVAVKTGDTVKQGDKIGEAGDTGHTEDGIRVGVYRFPLEDVALVTGADGTVSAFTVNGEVSGIGME